MFIKLSDSVTDKPIYIDMYKIISFEDEVVSLTNYQFITTIRVKESADEIADLIKRAEMERDRRYQNTFDNEYKTPTHPLAKDGSIEELYKVFRLNPNPNNPENPCMSCDYHKKTLGLKETIVGDIPCQWCKNSPFRVTCNTSVKENSGSISGDRQDG